MPRISVIIPSYNHEKYIDYTIQSILTQTFEDFEIIITDDGSEDKTVEKIKQFDDPRISLFVFEQNLGACAAVNNCLQYVTGEFVALINSDDEWEPQKLQVQLDFLEKNPEVGACFTLASFIDENGDPFINEEHPFFNVFKGDNRGRYEWLNYFFFNGNCLCHPSILIRKEVYSKVGYFDERFASIPDLEMWIRICTQTNIHILSEKLLKFRIREGEINASGPNMGNYIRTRFELKQVLNLYKEMDLITLTKTFPELEQYKFEDKLSALFLLGQLAIKSSEDFRKLWGLEVIFEVLRDPKELKVLNSFYKYSFKEFIEDTKNSDVFNLALQSDLWRENQNFQVELEKVSSYAKSLEREIDAIKASILWKFRKFLKKLKRFL